ncbi:MAG: hypothetical protein ACTHNU_18530 [Gaiellales bacterium]|jgi:hypothetical protein
MYIHSGNTRVNARESETEYFTRLAREHSRNQRRERRQRMLRKLIRRAPRDRRPA